MYLNGTIPLPLTFLLLGIVNLDDSTRCRNHPVDTVVIGQPHLNDIHVFPFDTTEGFGGEVLPISKWFQWYKRREEI